MEEIWKVYPLNPNYYVSNLGRIKNKKEHIMSPKYSGGYAFISASLNGHKTTTMIHRMVKITFDPIDNYDSYAVDHINGIRSDNRLENLRWITEENNTLAMLSMRKDLNKELTRIIQKLGYEKTLKLLKTL